MVISLASGFVHSTILVLSRLELAPYDHMNIAFLLYADRAVYQICTPTVNSHCPKKGTISVAAVQGLDHSFSGHASLLGTGQSEAIRVPMQGSWQVTRQNMNFFCHNCVTQNVQCTLFYACIFNFMSPHLNKKCKT